MASNAPPVDDVVHQCLVAYGNGTGGVWTRSAAIQKLVTFFGQRFGTALALDPLRFTGADPQHRLEEIWVLRNAELLGRLAAQYATARAALTIDVQDVETARIAVINAAGPNPGVWCN
jgi:hypothetical protein